MTPSPTITRVIAVPGRGAAYRPPTYQPQPSEIISVGLVLDRSHIAWGECVPAPGAPSLRAQDGLRTIQDLVIPALLGHRLVNFPALSAKIDALTETVTETVPLPQPEPSPPGRGMSRRALLTGQLEPDPSPPEPPIETITVERAIHPALRHGVAQALLAGLAQMQGVTVMDVLLDAYDLPRPAGAVPIHVDAGTDFPHGAAPGVYHRAASLGYTIAGHDAATALGEGGARLQGQVRRLKDDILAPAGDAYRPTLHLNVNGGLGVLFDHKPGRVLGALVGLEQAAKPYPVRVADPVLHDSRAEQIEAMQELGEFVRMRGMALQLAAGAWIETAGDVGAFLDAGAAHAVVVDVGRMGSLDQVAAAILAGRERDATVLLRDSTETTGWRSPMLAHLALATRPALVASPPGRGDAGIVHLQQEMARTLAWLRTRGGTPS